jgi:hypothetical protein
VNKEAIARAGLQSQRKKINNERESRENKNTANSATFSGHPVEWELSLVS